MSRFFWTWGLETSNDIIAGNGRVLKAFIIIVWLYICLKEANSLDRIKMTEFWFDFDRKIYTPTHLNIGT